MEEKINNFLVTLENSIKLVDDNLKHNFLLYKINTFLEENDNIIYKNTLTKILSQNNLCPIEKIEYEENKSEIILITQYYIAKDENRHKENNICLLNNIINPLIDKIYLLNEEEYDLELIFSKIDNSYRKKVRQTVIEKRLSFYDAFTYANTYHKNKIVIIANLDIFFNENIETVKNYNFNDLFISLSRYDLQNDYNFNGPNNILKFKHEGPLGDPCIDSADSWIYKSPIRINKNMKQIMLGTNGCDTIINNMCKNMGYNVINPVNSILSIHYHMDNDRNKITNNNTRSHSEKEYNENKNYQPENYEHLYVVQKEIELCEKIETFCTFCTKNSYKDLRLLLKSIELYHKDIPIYILCDNWVKNKIIEEKYDLLINIKEDLEKYTNMTRKIMEDNNIFKDFLYKKLDTLEYALEYNETTLFLDSDIILVNKMDLLIGKDYDVGLSPHNIFEESEKKFGKYNVGFVYIKNKEVLNYWRNLMKQNIGYYEQGALDYFEQKFKVFKFDDSYNYGWWRLFQCEDINKRVNSFNYDKTSVYYEFKTLKCVHTHFYEMNDNITMKYNKFIIDLLTEIKHPMLKHINNKKDIKYKKENEETNNEENEQINKEENEEINKEEKNKKKIASFTQTYGNERWTEILLQKYDKMGQYLRNQCDIIVFSFHNCPQEFIDKSTEYISSIYNKNKLKFLKYNNMEYLYSIRNTLDYFKNEGITDILFMNDDEFMLNNIDNINNIKNIDQIFTFYINNDIKWFNFYGLENIPQNKKEKKSIKVNDSLTIYCFSTIDYKKDNLYAWSQTTSLYNIDFCLDLYNNKLPENSWNIEETFSYYFHNNDCDRWGCDMELIRAINLHGKNLSSLSLYDNLKRFFLNYEEIYNIINTEEKNLNKTKEEKKYIIIPKQPRNDYWNHNNDTFRELVYMWKEEGLCEIIEEDTKHVWYNKIGDVLLYDRPTLDWLNKDINVKFNKILLANPCVIEELRSKGSNWIFWGRHPKDLEILSKEVLDYKNRVINSIFIGKIENEIQLKYRSEDWEKYVELYMMHKHDEEYLYSQEEYLNLLKQSKFGLCLRGFGGKCNREIELMGLGTVPIVEKNVDMTYYNKLEENVHYFRVNNGEEFKNIIEQCSENQWTIMSQNCVKWYNENCSVKGSFNTTQKIINTFKNNIIEKTPKNENKFFNINYIKKTDFTDIFNINNTYI